MIWAAVPEGAVAFFISICLLIGKNNYLCMRNTDRLRFRMIKKAQVAELVDALVSGASGFAIVQVRVLFWAPFLKCAGGGIGRHATLRG